MNEFSVRQLEVIYCDDVRDERSGKRIYVGVYKATMFVPEFPALLPKFCVVLTLQYSADRAPDKLRFLVLRDDELIAEKTLPDGEPKKPFLNKEAEGMDGPLCNATIQFDFSPFEVAGPCTIKVRAEVDGTMIRTSGLRIRSFPNDA